jgi:hypothetical protein
MAPIAASRRFCLTLVVNFLHEVRPLMHLDPGFRPEELRQKIPNPATSIIVVENLKFLTLRL